MGYLWKIRCSKKEKGVSFDLEITQIHSPRNALDIENQDYEFDMNPIKKIISYDELNKNPVLKKYIKGKSLEKSLVVLSVASILASAFFISNNITGNAILTATSNDSGIIGAGLFVLGLLSFILAKNI